jgi:thiamine biosynthesis lipoprotein
MVSVSVIAPNAADSDALSTAFFVMGREATQEYCRQHPNIKVVMMEEAPSGELEVTRIGF